VLYHLLRHATLVDGNESPSDIETLARNTFGGKRILELGSGPGFFLYTLRELGADVTGVDLNDTFKEQTSKAGLNMLHGDARKLGKLVGDQKYDFIFSKDFLTFSVTRKDAEPIMKGVYDALKTGGITLHQINYRKMPEEKYFETVDRFCAKNGQDPARFRTIWSEMVAEQKEIILRRNILNISLEHLEELGFKPFTQYRLDAHENLTITLGK
jgi:SAM-dependent methyltransferase